MLNPGIEISKKDEFKNGAKAILIAVLVVFAVIYMLKGLNESKANVESILYRDVSVEKVINSSSCAKNIVEAYQKENIALSKRSLVGIRSMCSK